MKGSIDGRQEGRQEDEVPVDNSTTASVHEEGFIQELKLRVKQMNTSGASEADKQAIVKYCMRELIVCIQQMRNMQHERRVVKQWRNRAETETLMTAQVL